MHSIIRCIFAERSIKGLEHYFPTCRTTGPSQVSWLFPLEKCRVATKTLTWLWTVNTDKRNALHWVTKSREVSTPMCLDWLEHDLSIILHQHWLLSLLQTPVHASLSTITIQHTEALPDSPPIQQAVACAFSSAALTACSSVPHVTPLSPYHIHRRLNRVSSMLPTLLKSCYCTVSFGMERKVHTALHLSPTLGRNSDRVCASLGRDRRKSERGEGNFIRREKQWL